MDVLRVAIVGCGRISDLHVLGYRDRKDAKIVALCDKNYSRLVKKAKSWGIKGIFSDYKELLKEKDIDLIELLVPHNAHAEMAIAAAQAGKHISVQKPMAISVHEADQMISAAENSNVKLRIYENFIFYPPIVMAKKIVDAGEIGEPQMLRLHVTSSLKGHYWKIPVGAMLWRLELQTLWRWSNYF